MKIAVICANGKQGKLIVKEAIAKGADVTAVIREENKSEATKVIKKDLFDLTAADLNSFDVVIDAFGAWTEDALPQHSTSLKHLCDILSGTQTRLLVVGGAGSLYINPEHTVCVSDGADFPDMFKPLAAAMAKGLSELRKRDDVKWTYISPAGDFQADGARTGEYILGGEELTLNSKGESVISYADYAVAMVDEALSGNNIQKRISVVSEINHKKDKEKSIMNKNTFQTVKLVKGEMNVYDFGSVKLHAYKTNDFIDDEVFIVEKNGKAVIIESPCFFDNNKELAEYLKNVEVEGMLVAYHGAGATFLPDIPKYATRNAVDFSKNGGGKDLINKFTGAFGESFDPSVHEITNVIESGRVTIGGIDFVIKQTDDAFDVEIPQINAVYTHMLGHDCHSIVAGAGHADAMIAELRGYIEKGYALLLTSHYIPEDLKDAQTKIDYLENLKKIAANVQNADEFKAEVGRQYPQYSGQNYLDMTAGFFFA